jgi:NitT/TauT family transport system permease protein
VIRKLAVFGAGVVSLVLAWQFGSMVNPEFFPPPADVATLAYDISTSPTLTGDTALYHLRVTLRRIAIITVLAFVVSIVLGIGMAALPIENPMSNFLPFWMAFPPLVVILFCMTLLGFSDTTIIVAIFVSTAPYGIVNVWKGADSVDSNLLEMADVFGMNRRTVWRKVYFPAVLPYLFSTGRYLFSMVWKLTMLAEVFGVSVGIGARVRFWFNQGNLEFLLAYFLIFFVTLALIEYGVIMQVEKRAFSWRSDTGTVV